MEEKSYLAILEESLEKKIDLLRRLQQLNEEQATILKDPNALPEVFDENVKKKEVLIERLASIDNGFEQVFAKVEDELQANREKYRDTIARMQELIREITQRSVNLQVQEKRNADLARSKFSQVRQQVKEIRQNRKVVSSYYQNMMKTSVIDPQFMDRKK